MMAFRNESNKERLEEIIRQEIVPKLKILQESLTEECIEYIILNSRLKRVTKDQYIQEPGTYEDGRLIFLYSGVAHRFYYHRETDKKFVTRLWKKNEIIFDVNSYINSEDRLESVQMLEDGELISMDYYHLKDLLNRFPKLFPLLLYIQIESEKYNMFYQKLLKLTVDERVKLFLEHNPMFNKVKNKDAIALYLGMSRCRFSTAYALYKQKKDSESL